MTEGMPVKPIKEVAAKGGIPGPGMKTEKLMHTTELSRSPIGKIPKARPVGITHLPKMGARRR